MNCSSQIKNNGEVDISCEEREINEEIITKYNAFPLKPELIEKDVQTDDMRELLDSISLDMPTEGGIRGTNQNI